MTYEMALLYISIIISICTSTISGGRLKGRIVSGVDAVPGEHPYAVSYRYYDKHNCGGSIIGEDWILSAAHCIHEDYNYVSNILFGTIKVENGLHPQENMRNISKTLRHPLYQPYEGHPNDIGLLKLELSIKFNWFAQPVELPNQDAPTPVWASATLLGWGYPKDNTSVTELLQEVNVYVYPDDICKEVHGKNLTTAVHICAGVPEGGKGQCSGDSGGPLTINKVQVGIVSWSVKPCAIKGYPGVLTRVSSFRYWITEITGI